MYVPSYQMHNVLNVYSKQLRQNMVLEGKNKLPQQRQTDRVNLTSVGNRQATIEKVSRDILNKISRYGSLKDSRQQVYERKTVDIKEEALPEKAENKTFVFNAIDTINKKSTNTLSVDDSSFLIQRLDQLAKMPAIKRRNPGSENRSLGSDAGVDDSRRGAKGGQYD
jgi:hypothetical protein